MKIMTFSFHPFLVVIVRMVVVDQEKFHVHFCCHHAEHHASEKDGLKGEA